MPKANARLCPRGHLVTGRSCALCAYTVGGRALDRRGPSSRYGYDYAWTRLRDRHAREHPLCEECWRLGRVEPMADVDHVLPFHGRDDPRRLDPSNLRSLCKSCHRRKTLDDARRARGRGTGGVR